MVCRTRREDTHLVRVGRREGGSWYLGRGRGRGAWWCCEGECGSKLSAQHLARALGEEVTAGSFEAFSGLRTSKSR